MKVMKAPRVSVEVTPEIIADATREDSGHCMIAEAVKAALPHARQVSVDIQTIRYSDPRTRARYIFLTPRLAQSALVAFDAGEEIEPFKVQLRNPHITTMSTRAHPERQTKPEAELTEHEREVRQQKRDILADARSRLAKRQSPPVESTPRQRTPKLTGQTSHKPGPKGGGSPLPRLEGGESPPKGALASGGKIPAGRRRQYGIRALDRGSSLLLREGKGE